jgi:transketolase
MSEKEMRAVYCDTLLRLAADNPNIAVVEADLMKSTGTFPFKEAYPERAFDCGVAEADMIGLSAGLSNVGLIPFASTFACFAARRDFDQFFISGNYARLNVKLVGTDPGVTAAFNGGTHMAFEDIGLMRIIPGLVVCEPSDPASLAGLVEAAASHYGCVYLRLQRKAAPLLYSADEKFKFGEAKVLKDGKDVLIVSLGAVMTNEALKAAQSLKNEGIDAAVIDLLTVKPLDREKLLHYAQKTGAVVTAENHQAACGMGSAVAELLAAERPTPLERVAVEDVFGEVGTQEWLMEHFGLTAAHIVDKAKKVISRKK